MRGTMSYQGFVWPNNPKEITYSVAEQTATALFPGGANAVDATARRPRVIQGHGSFYGPRAQVAMNELEQIFLNGRSGVLLLPNRRPLNAWMTELTVEEQVKPDQVSYRFVFTEDSNQATTQHHGYMDSTVVRPGETLFHIAARTGIPVETLGAKNSLPGCFALKEGDCIRLH